MTLLRTSWMASLAVLLCICLPACAQSQTPMNDMDAVRAPELEPNLGWINTDKPLRFSKELKGHVVLLDFWTYCCINCMHILPDLEYLEKKYADQPFAVVGVHSAKFDNEEGRETILAAVNRYKIHHPVVIDDDLAIWERYTAQAWPTFVLVDSRGRVRGMTSGEGNRQELDAAIQMLLDEGRANDTLASAPIKINRQGSIMATAELAFPGKILADEKSGRLFISDSNHNRIVVATLPDTTGTARLIATIGSGAEGAINGSFTSATFHNPQGMALKGNLLYIADTDNHLIREANLETSTVKTLAGTGKQGYDRRGGGKGAEQVIASPWALVIDNNRLFIAMAGTHQIWTTDLASGITKAFSGDGRENITDGPASRANFAQPSGLAIIKDKLYVADSEVSAIREVDTSTGQARTIVGQGLFIFGDENGRGNAVRLQHPLGVAAWNDQLFIADTYNHKIKRINPATREATSLYGTGKPGTSAADGKPAFFEPGGLSVAAGYTYVADTNNHRIVRINLANNEWTTLNIEGLTRPAK